MLHLKNRNQGIPGGVQFVQPEANWDSTKIPGLAGELVNATVPADAQATILDIKAIYKQLDDIVPDAPELPPPTIPPTEPAARR